MPRLPARDTDVCEVKVWFPEECEQLLQINLLPRRESTTTLISELSGEQHTNEKKNNNAFMIVLMRQAKNSVIKQHISYESEVVPLVITLELVPGL